MKWLTCTIIAQVQTERDKHAYEYEQLQSQLDKSAGQVSRAINDRDDAVAELNRTREKLDKLMVRHTHTNTPHHHHSFYRRKPHQN